MSDVTCASCEAIYPAECTHCSVCGEPNPLREKQMRESAMIGYESARPFDLTAWTGAPT